MTLIIYRFYALIFKALTEIIENLELCDLENCRAILSCFQWFLPLSA